MDHVYQIGKYEVTAGQYTEFLNAVAEADPNELYNTAMGDPFVRRRKHPANRFFPQLQLQRGRRLGQPAGELRELLGRGPVCQLAPQRPAHRGAGSRNDRGRRVSRRRQPDAVWPQRRRDSSSSPPRTSGTRRPITIKTAGLAASYFDYPTGTNAIARETTSPKRPTRATTRTTIINGYLIGSPYYRTVVGEFELSDSPYGTFDQGGNV